MIHVFVVDDQAVVRAGLKLILSLTPDIRVVGEAENGHDALNKMNLKKQEPEFRCDAVLLDVNLPDESGLYILKQLKSRHPKLSVLMFTIYSEEQYALRSIKAGAAGYLTKNSAPEEIINAIRKVSGGEKYITPAVAELLAASLGGKPCNLPHEKLSDREFQVLCLIATGNTVTNIAAELFLSPKTVSTYRTRLLEKMNMTTNAQLTYYALANKLVEYAG